VEFVSHNRSLQESCQILRDWGKFLGPLRRRVDHRDGRLADLLSTHPPINRRIMLLYQMAGMPAGAVARVAGR
jgi:Zn-dependent protease with chaperone function